jgi:3-oxoacyl-[acyl-carrier-protein] synthase II
LRVAAVIGTAAGGVETFQQQAIVQHSRGFDAVERHLFAGFLPNMAAARIAIKYGIRAPSHAIGSACTTRYPWADAYLLPNQRLEVL